jgi:hypothetical protein
VSRFTSAPMKLHDAAIIFANISDITFDELDAMGLDAWRAMKMVRQFSKQGEAFTGFYDGRPVCIFGSVPDNGVRSTWFVAAEEYFNIGISAVRFCRDFCADLVKRYGEPLESVSWSKSKPLERWFAVHKFQVVERADLWTKFRLDVSDKVNKIC